MRNLFLLVLLGLCASCHSLERLGRVSPLADEVSSERINLWPLYYQNGDQFAVLWPVYDHDEQGFALRPVITNDGKDWELFPPIAWWNTESGSWVFIPAYATEDAWGVFPLMGFGDLNYVTLAWWTDDSWGLFPLASVGSGFNWVGPAWWHRNEDDEVTISGLFPVYATGESFNHVGPVFWGHDDKGEYFYVFPLYGNAALDDGGELTWIGPVLWSDRQNGDTRYMIAFPLFGYGSREDGSGMALSLLGGRGWDEEGETTWLNVLGPIYHYDREGDDVETHVLWPFVHWSGSDNKDTWRFWPLIGRSQEKNSKDGHDRSKTWVAAGLIEASGEDGIDSGRIAPLFSYRSEEGGNPNFLDWLTLYGFKRYKEDKSSLHVGTPLVFNYHEQPAGCRWNALLKIFDYESDGTESSFDFLWYVYRQRSVGGETRRDFFPFVSWDSGEEHSEFSFVWRLFHWERNGDQTGGHVLFIPWGSTD